MVAQVMLTFDVEDFINDGSTEALHKILELLHEQDLVGLFFITGHMAEKLGNYPRILDLLKSHEIGFHSSSHSVRPTIFEYCNVEEHEKAYGMSLQRENAHINPLTGEIEGTGGISSLRSLFPRKHISCFRAPGLCWTPPNLEALKKLGIKFDFSASISNRPVFHEGITFFPYPHFYIPRRGLTYRVFLRSLFEGLTVMGFHPCLFATKVSWDSIYYRGNPRSLSRIPSITNEERKSLFRDFETLLKQLKLLQRIGLANIVWQVRRASKRLRIGRADLEQCYERSVNWPITYFNYMPKSFSHQFLEYFGPCVR